ncbi:MAG: type I methionyl aminopeptidase [Bacteroidales bacterium]|nr:type I methionyl aminopeptidase [Bacteroidales bacterium]
MITKTVEEIELLKKSSLLVGKTLGEIAKVLKPGVNTLFLDKLAEEYIRDNGGVPAFKGYNGYPATLCISINEQIVHGIPSNRLIKDGDIVSVDCGATLNGYVGDYAYTFIVGEVDEKTEKLVRVTKESLMKGLAEAVPGKHIGDIGHAIQLHVERNGFYVVRELVGHGIGKKIHEKPEVPNYGKRGKGMLLEENMVLCVEPMVNAGTSKIIVAPDNWTIFSQDRSNSAHFEHMVVVKEIPEVISTYEYIEKNKI